MRISLVQARWSYAIAHDGSHDIIHHSYVTTHRLRFPHIIHHYIKLGTKKIGNKNFPLIVYLIFSHLVFLKL